jgi:hypothetical protein
MKCTSSAACKFHSANKLLSSSRHKESHGFVEITSVSNLPVLRRNGGVRILLDFSDAVDVSAYFRPFDEMPSDEANKNPSSTMDGEAHGPGDDATVWELPVFLRNGWDPMGHDSNHADLTPCLRSGSSFDVALPKRTSRL